MVVAFARMLELYLDEVGALGIAWHVSQPVVGVQLMVLASAGSTAEAAVSVVGYFVFQIFVIHILSFIFAIAVR